MDFKDGTKQFDLGQEKFSKKVRFKVEHFRFMKTLSTITVLCLVLISCTKRDRDQPIKTARQKLIDGRWVWEWTVTETIPDYLIGVDSNRGPKHILHVIIFSDDSTFIAVTFDKRTMPYTRVDTAFGGRWHLIDNETRIVENQTYPIGEPSEIFVDDKMFCIRMVRFWNDRNYNVELRRKYYRNIKDELKGM